MDVTRRDFIKISTASLAAVGLGVSLEPVKAYARPLKIKQAKMSTTICPYCAVGCGIIVHARKGKVINTEGDPDHPIALGALYNGQAMPPADAAGDKNDIKMLMTRGGNQIIFNDEDGKEEIRITNKDGKNSIVMEVSGPSISFESSGDISIKGNNITIESQLEIKLKAGSDLKAESSANTTIEAGANLKSKGGAMVNLEGATVTVKGNPIQLN